MRPDELGSVQGNVQDYITCATMPYSAHRSTPFRCVSLNIENQKFKSERVVTVHSPAGSLPKWHVVDACFHRTILCAWR